MYRHIYKLIIDVKPFQNISSCDSTLLYNIFPGMGFFIRIAAISKLPSCEHGKR